MSNRSQANKCKIVKVSPKIHVLDRHIGSAIFYFLFVISDLKTPRVTIPVLDRHIGSAILNFEILTSDS